MADTAFSTASFRIGLLDLISNSTALFAESKSSSVYLETFTLKCFSVFDFHIVSFRLI